MLSLAVAPFEQCSKVTAASRDLGCDKWSIYQSRLPFQTGALARASAVTSALFFFKHYELMFNIARFHIREVRMWFFDFFCYKNTLGNIRSHAETPCSKFCPDLSVRLKDIAEKADPRKAETDSGVKRKLFLYESWFRNLSHLLCVASGHQKSGNIILYFWSKPALPICPFVPGV